MASTGFAENLETFLEAFPKVAVEGTVDSFEGFFGRGIDRDVELCYVIESCELFGMLGVADEERRNVRFVKERKERVDMRIKDWLADERESTMANAEGFCEAGRYNTGDTFHHLDLAIMTFDYTLEDVFWRINLPTPGGTDRVGAMTPAENALVGAG